MPETRKRPLHTVGQYIVLFMFLSFAGWAVETLLCSLEAGRWCNRGFITLPLCTIYGFTVLGAYFLLGTPQKGGVLLKKIPSGPMRVLLYFLLAAGLTTATELVTGWFFARICGVSLWDYSGYRFHFNGYICLEFFVVWGILFLIGMRYAFEPVKRLIGSIPRKGLLWGSAVSGVLLCVDWIASYAKIFG